MSESISLRAQADAWFGFLRDREGSFRPRFNTMVGFAYGYALAALDVGRLDVAQKKVEWLMVSARKHGALFEELPNGGHLDGCAYVGGISARCSCSAIEKETRV